MKRRPARHHANTFGVAIFIGSLCVLLVLAAILIKLLLVVHKSTFDGEHQFVVAEIEPTQTRFVIFNPDNNTLTTLVVTGNLSSNINYQLGFPMDGMLKTSQDILPADLPFALVTHDSSLTRIDALRLWLFVFFGHPDVVFSQTLSMHSLANVSAHIFSDATVYKEALSVSVSNGTDVSGLGGRINNLLTNIGANVINVTTSPTTLTTSSVAYSGNLSYTAARIAKLLQIPLVHLPSSTVSAITVTIGTDKNWQ